MFKIDIYSVDGRDDEGNAAHLLQIEKKRQMQIVMLLHIVLQMEKRQMELSMLQQNMQISDL
jgi:hypothetical protein